MAFLYVSLSVCLSVPSSSAHAKGENYHHIDICTYLFTVIFGALGLPLSLERPPPPPSKNVQEVSED